MAVTWYSVLCTQITPELVKLPIRAPLLRLGFSRFLDQLLTKQRERQATDAIRELGGRIGDLIKQNKEESRYSTRPMVLIKSATVKDRIRICAISNSDSKSNVLDHSAIGTPTLVIIINKITKKRYCLVSESEYRFCCIPIVSPSIYNEDQNGRVSDTNINVYNDNLTL
ncbi:hypothetical protein J6590_062299 [Homalodisca vitripennis]|nr:hypothetical protein J6590_062299 [Homalodisca vitripennis]